MSRRVALVATTTTTEPPELLASRLRGLRAAGWDAHLMCKGPQWLDAPALREPALAPHVDLRPARRRHLPPRSLRAHPLQLGRHLRTPGETGPFDERLLRLRPDLIHFHSGAAGWKGARLKRLLGCRIVVSFRDDGLDLEDPRARDLPDWADRLVFSSEALRDRGLALGWPAERTEVLPGPGWSAPASVPAPVREGGPLRVLSVGSLIWEQGFEHSVHAIAQLRDRGVPAEYRIVGRGDHLVAVAFARHQLGLAEQVRLLHPDGPRQLATELDAADVFLDPAVTDTVSPEPLQAARSLGVPIVATPRPGLDDGAAIAVPRRDPAAIADALERLASDPDLRTRSRAPGGRPEAERSLDEHIRRLEQLYRRGLA